MEDYYLTQARGIASSLITAGLLKHKNAHKAESLLRVALEERFSSEKVTQHIIGDSNLEKTFQPLLGFVPIS